MYSISRTEAPGGLGPRGPRNGAPERERERAKVWHFAGHPMGGRTKVRHFAWHPMGGGAEGLRAGLRAEIVDI